MYAELTELLNLPGLILFHCYEWVNEKYQFDKINII